MLLLILGTVTAMAQEQFNPEKIKAEVHNTIVAEAKFTKEEEAAFFPLFDAMKDGDAPGFEREINRLLTPSISYMDSYESFYHGFMTGILSGSSGYMIKSNRESGNGRSDMLLKTGDVFAKAFVIELKTVKQEGNKPVTMEMMDEAADEAIKQIDDNAYADALLEDGYGNIGRYGISFFKKRCRVHYKDGYEQ